MSESIVVPSIEHVLSSLVAKTVRCPGCLNRYEVGCVNSEGKATTTTYHTDKCTLLTYLAGGCS